MGCGSGRHTNKRQAKIIGILQDTNARREAPYLVPRRRPSLKGEHKVANPAARRAESPEYTGPLRPFANEKGKGRTSVKSRIGSSGTSAFHQSGKNIAGAGVGVRLSQSFL